MSKRGAVSELNDRNWDDEEEPEEAGIFQPAPDNVLQQRVIKKAKRRVLGEESSGAKSTAFGGFSGFGLKPPQSKPADSFSGFKPKDNDETRPTSFGGAGAVNGNEDVSFKSQRDSKDSSYLNFLKSLNESVLAWIKQHVEDNPYIILTPIFKDYEAYLRSVQSDTCNNASGTRDLKNNGNGSSTEKITAASVVEKGPTFSFAATSSDSSMSKASSIPTFSSNTTSTGTFKFGPKTEASSVVTPAFSFGSTNSLKGGFSFSLAKTSQDSNDAGSSHDTEAKDDEEYVPPKPEVKEIVEEGALYSIRCKLFHQKEGKWVDRGVGNLHLKPVAEEKTQLLVRADTNLGNILLNILLNSSMPVNKQGKNNVVLVCIPNPPIEMKGDNNTPIPMLIRVKTEDDADMLMKTIKERQQLL